MCQCPFKFKNCTTATIVAGAQVYDAIPYLTPFPSLEGGVRLRQTNRTAGENMENMENIDRTVEELWCARIRISQRDSAGDEHSGNLGANALVGRTPSAASMYCT